MGKVEGMGSGGGGGGGGVGGVFCVAQISLYASVYYAQGLAMPCALHQIHHMSTSCWWFHDFQTTDRVQ